MEIKERQGERIIDRVALKAGVMRWLSKEDNWGACFEYLFQLREELQAEERKEDLSREFRDESGRTISREERVKRSIDRQLSSDGLVDDPIAWLKLSHPEMYKSLLQSNLLQKANNEAQEHVAWKLRRLGDFNGIKAGDHFEMQGGKLKSEHDHEPRPFHLRSLTIQEIRGELLYTGCLMLSRRWHILRSREQDRDEILAKESLDA